MTYQSPRVNNASERSISVILNGPVWKALDDLARKMNKSKAELARGEIVKLVKNRVSKNRDARGDG